MSLEDFKRAWRELEVEEANRALIGRLITYIIINGFLIFINIYTNSSFLWFPFPLVGWGVGLALHFAFSIQKFVISKWEEKVAKVEARMRRMKETQG